MFILYTVFLFKLDSNDITVNIFRHENEIDRNSEI